MSSRMLPLALLLGCTLLSTGCTYERHSAQYAFAARPVVAAGEAILAEETRDFARQMGLVKETRSGNGEHLEKQGIHVISFTGADGSYIAVNNVGDKQCFSFAMYSSRGEAEAADVGSRLIERLNARKITAVPIVPGAACG